LAYLLTNTKHLHSRQNKIKLHWVHVCAVLAFLQSVTLHDSAECPAP